MNKTYKILGVILVVVLILGGMLFGSYNNLVKKDQAVSASWAQVQADYQRRSDLIPNLVSTVKGAANFEQKTLTDVVEARAKATALNIDASNLTPEGLAEFQSAQTNLSGALGKLLAISESYPQLTATESFRGLQTQLEGTENRITVARRDFNTSIQDYNTSIKTFPSNILAGMFGFVPKDFFKSNSGADVVPEVKF